MKFTIEKQEEKPLVERLEVIFKIKDFETTPSNVQTHEEAVKQLNKQAELIIVKHIHQKFGKSEAQALVYAYKNKEALNKFEPKPKKKKGKPGEKSEEKQASVEKPAEKPAAEAPTPVETPKEETKAKEEAKEEVKEAK